MKQKTQVHNLIILDESGSMNSIKKLIISGFNEVVQTVKGIAQEYPEQEHYISFISFSSLKLKTHLDCQLFTELDEPYQAPNCLRWWSVCRHISRAQALRDSLPNTGLGW